MKTKIVLEIESDKFKGIFKTEECKSEDEIKDAEKVLHESIKKHLTDYLTSHLEEEFFDDVDNYEHMPEDFESFNDFGEFKFTLDGEKLNL